MVEMTTNVTTHFFTEKMFLLFLNFDELPKTFNFVASFSSDSDSTVRDACAIFGENK